MHQHNITLGIDTTMPAMSLASLTFILMSALSFMHAATLMHIFYDDSTSVSFSPY